MLIIMIIRLKINKQKKSLSQKIHYLYSGVVQMKKNSTLITIISLLCISAVIYFIQIWHFDAPRDTFFYLMQDLAFLPVQIALVTVIVGKIISAHEKRERLNKTNILVSAFFSEIGSELVNQMLCFISNTEGLVPYLDIKVDWTSEDFAKAVDSLKKQNIQVECTKQELDNLKRLLREKRRSIMFFLSNPMLLEHDAFTDMLWAIFHLADELLARDDVYNLPDTDIEHLNNDINRTISTILIHWLGYMNHIKMEYPYLFSLEARRNPINGVSEIIIK